MDKAFRKEENERNLVLSELLSIIVSKCENDDFYIYIIDKIMKWISLKKTEYFIYVNTEDAPLYVFIKAIFEKIIMKYASNILYCDCINLDIIKNNLDILYFPMYLDLILDFEYQFQKTILNDNMTLYCIIGKLFKDLLYNNEVDCVMLFFKRLYLDVLMKYLSKYDFLLYKIQAYFNQFPKFKFEDFMKDYDYMQCFGQIQRESFTLSDTLIFLIFKINLINDEIIKYTHSELEACESFHKNAYFNFKYKHFKVIMKEEENGAVSSQMSQCHFENQKQILYTNQNHYLKIQHILIQGHQKGTNYLLSSKVIL